MTEPAPDRHIPELVGLEEAAELIGVSKTYAHRMVMRGELRGRRVGKVWVFRKVVAERMGDQRRRDGKNR